MKECLVSRYLVPMQTLHLEIWVMISSILDMGFTVKSAGRPTPNQKDLSVRTPCLHTSELEHCMNGISWNSSKQEPALPRS